MPHFTESEAVRWPFGKAKETAITPFAATMTASVPDRLTVLTLPTLTADATLDVTIGSEQLVGDLLLLKVPAQTDGFDLTLGAGIDGPAIVGVTGKTKQQLFMFTGAAFTAVGASVQIN